MYRKYRPIDFDNVFGQEEVVTVIKNAIINNKISHAYLFSGPRGTGKTTIAKIIARLVNCEKLIDGKPCGKCYNCLNFNNSNDVVEIDAASNNGVDEIRELRDKINLVPSNSKYKVYIIDEVHMLTNQAFNALLKTLEEPPSHVIFILATTEPHKIPLTISSRCQKFRFSKIDDMKIVNRIKQISELEKIDVDDDALFEIARMADGGMRDAINILDQLVSYANGKITLEDVYKVNGTVSYNDIFQLIECIINNDKIKIINFVDYLNQSGKDINKFVDELILFLRDVILYKSVNNLSNINEKNEKIKTISNALSYSDLYSFIENLNEVQNTVRNSTHGAIVLMTFLLKCSDFICINNKTKEKNISREISENTEHFDENISREIISNKINNEIDIISNDEIELRVNNALALASKDTLIYFKNNWNLLDEYICDKEFSVVVGLLRDSSVVVASNEYIIIASDLNSIVDRINENTLIIEKLFKKLFDYKLFVVAITTDNWKLRKDEYVKHIKSGKKYVVKEKNTNNTIIVDKKTDSPIDELIELIGDNVIEYR